MSRDVNLHLRLTVEENELLAHLSDLTRCSKSQVLRNLLHGATLIEAPPVAYNELLVELRRVGTRLPAPQTNGACPMRGNGTKRLLRCASSNRK